MKPYRSIKEAVDARIVSGMKEPGAVYVAAPGFYPDHRRQGKRVAQMDNNITECIRVFAEDISRLVRDSVIEIVKQSLGHTDDRF